MGIPHFNIPLNLQHAATIARRLAYHLERLQKLKSVKLDKALIRAESISEKLFPFHVSEQNPAPDDLAVLISEVAALAREMVDEVEGLNAGDDRFGQAVRNLFECLVLGEEGARISLRAGENPDSALRPQ
jgi:hypothetical protein